MARPATQASKLLKRLRQEDISNEEAVSPGDRGLGQSCVSLGALEIICLSIMGLVCCNDGFSGCGAAEGLSAAAKVAEAQGPPKLKGGLLAQKVFARFQCSTLWQVAIGILFLSKKALYREATA